ncbi:HU family DNA-binding protein [Pseudodonghicola sp.]|uniref:HU family DNA-binding protein n=1 Tax=Pseudodonghicola sp. TaxID=1969463 RepID=UPI003A979C47
MEETKQTIKKKKGKAGGETRAGGGAEMPAGPKLKVAKAQGAAETDLRMKELLDRVVERTQAKKADAKPVIEAMLALLGETLAEGRGFNLAPLGKLSINRTAEKGPNRVVVAKLRQKLTPGTQDTEDSDGAPD